jgi:hypothetical protein
LMLNAFGLVDNVVLRVADESEGNPA